MLSTANGQITEIGNVEYIIGTGYTVNQLKMPFTVRGNTISSDFVLRADFSIRNSTTLIRKIVENETQVTAGQNRLFVENNRGLQFDQGIELETVL